MIRGDDHKWCGRLLLLALAGVVYSNSAMTDDFHAGLEVVAGRDAERLIVTGKQIDYWREKIGDFTYHNYVIHKKYTAGHVRVWECYHVLDQRSAPQDLTVRCFGHKDSN